MMRRQLTCDKYQRSRLVMEQLIREYHKSPYTLNRVPYLADGVTFKFNTLYSFYTDQFEFCVPVCIYYGRNDTDPNRRQTVFLMAYKNGMYKNIEIINDDLTTMFYS